MRQSKMPSWSERSHSKRFEHVRRVGSVAVVRRSTGPSVRQMLRTPSTWRWMASSSTRPHGLTRRSWPATPRSAAAAYSMPGRSPVGVDSRRPADPVAVDHALRVGVDLGVAGHATDHEWLEVLDHVARVQVHRVVALDDDVVEQVMGETFAPGPVGRPGNTRSGSRRPRD